MQFKHKNTAVVLLALSLIVTVSCNKAFETIPTPDTTSTDPTINDIINTDTSYSLLKSAVAKAGLSSVLGSKTNKLTLFAPDNAAFALSGISSAVIDALPATQVQQLLSYHVIPQQLNAASIPDSFPNAQMPTLLQLDPTNPLVRMSIFPSRRGNQLFVNNIPVKSADKQAVNGVIHTVYALVQPPSKLLAQIIYGDTTFSFLSAAIARADSGQTGLNKFDSLLKYPVVNFTVFAPTNTAVRQLLVGLGLPPDPSSFNYLPVLTVRGIVAYHLLGVRAFSVNLPVGPAQVRTLLGGPPYPPVTVDLTTGLPRLLGAGNGGAYSNTIAVDKNAVNGVVHAIDRVLLPQ